MKSATVNSFVAGLIWSLFGSLVAPLVAAAVTITSPDGTIEFVLDVNDAGELQYRATCDHRPVLLNGRIGLTVDGQNLGEAASLGVGKTREVDEREPMFGAHAIATNHFRELAIPVLSGEQKTEWAIEIRVYDDGIAFRYRVPGATVRQVEREATTWKMHLGGTVWFQRLSDRGDYEANFQEAPLSELGGRARRRLKRTDADSGRRFRSLVATPITVKLPDGPYLVVTEANLVDYSDMSLECVDDGTFRAYFHNEPAGWEWQGEIVSPWRATLISRDLNGIVNSDLVRNLCPPPAAELAHADWITPGRSSWHWMVTGRPKLADQRQWVDWTNQLGFEQYIIDDGWNRWKSDDEHHDAWACLRDVVEYAQSKDVKIWAWVNSKELLDHAARETYMKKAKSAGVVGLKVDFMKPANVEWVNWYDETLRDAANHQLMLDFHGSLKPSGRQRTWPNELTREAVRGREGGKQSGLHDTTLPFTRYVQGPADYTPTDFRPDRLKGSSWAHELSMAIVFTSPLLCYGGSPENYLQNEAVDVIRAIPSTWDETTVLSGSEIGKLAALARRRGDVWFVGVLNGEKKRTFTIDLSFLGSGSYRIDEFADSTQKPDAWERGRRSLTAEDKFTVTLHDDGGYVATLTRSNP